MFQAMVTSLHSPRTRKPFRLILFHCCICRDFESQLRTFDERAIDALRAKQAGTGIEAGMFTPAILDTIRYSGAALPARRIADARAGSRMPDNSQFNLPNIRVRSALPRLSRQLDGALRGGRLSAGSRTI